MGHYLQILLLVFTVVSDRIVQAYITCGNYLATQTRCYGSGAYCCGIYNDECCWETVYSYWWFWFIWAWVFILITACSICICIRRRRMMMAQPRYVIVEPQQTYGTLGSQGYGYAQTAPPAAPPTAPSYMEKPPPYSAGP